jgi:hypothetical protein
MSRATGRLARSKIAERDLLRRHYLDGRPNCVTHSTESHRSPYSGYPQSCVGDREFTYARKLTAGYENRADRGKCSDQPLYRIPNTINRRGEWICGSG